MMRKPTDSRLPGHEAAVTSTPVGSDARVLVLNAGSSSLKFALFSAGRRLERVRSGGIDRIGLADSELKINPGPGPLPVPSPEPVSRPEPAPASRRTVAVADHGQALDLVLGLLAEAGSEPSVAAVGHRVLHGGDRYSAPHLVDAKLIAELHRLSPLGPEHLPAQIRLLEALAVRFPGLPQVACFDTAFHRDLPRVARLLPLPRRYDAAGVRRYGFHGLSFAFLLEELFRLGDASAATGRVILAHLGNGASLAAVRDGRCVDTSMSFTPAAGLMMGRRSGDLDPGLVAYLAQTEGMTAERFHRMINHESGLLGVSELTSDMRELLDLEPREARAAEAVQLFCYQAKKWIGAFTAALGGLDTLVFSGGIGENNAAIRDRICAGLGFLGLALDESRNAANAALVSTGASRVAVRVIRTDEERMIARSTCRLLAIGAMERTD